MVFGREQASGLRWVGMGGRLELPRGITGFDLDTAPFDDTLFRRFGAVSHAIARIGRGRIGTLEDCAGQVTPNFHLAELHRPSGTAYLLCNAHYPWVAATLRLSLIHI